jgi:hypothetical protein
MLAGGEVDDFRFVRDALFSEQDAGPARTGRTGEIIENRHRSLLFRKTSRAQINCDWQLADVTETCISGIAM